MTSSHGTTDDSGGNPTLVTVRKLSDISNGLKDAVNDLLEERDRLNKDKAEFADMYYSFTMNGDLVSG